MSQPRSPKYLHRAIFPTGVAGPIGDDDFGVAIGTTAARHKRRWSGSPYCVPNEFIAGHIAQFLRLPIPAFGISSDANGQLYFSSLDFNFDSIELPRVIPDLLWEAFPKLCTGVILFDVLIANADRHDKNLAANRQHKPTEMRVFDHDQALFGGGSSLQGIKRLEKLQGRLGITAGPVSEGTIHCLLREMTSSAYMDDWFQRIDTIPNWYLKEVCSEARALGLTKVEANEVTSFLELRRNGLRDLIKQHQEDFPGVTDWSTNGTLSL